MLIREGEKYIEDKIVEKSEEVFHRTVERAIGRIVMERWKEIALIAMVLGYGGNKAKFLKNLVMERKNENGKSVS